MAWRGLRLNILACENINLIASSFHAMMVGQDGLGP
jgi:hypothetical protein